VSVLPRTGAGRGHGSDGTRRPIHRLSGDVDVNTLFAADPRIHAGWSGSGAAAPGISRTQIGVVGTVNAGQA